MDIRAGTGEPMFDIAAEHDHNVAGTALTSFRKRWPVALLGLGVGAYATAWLGEHVFEGKHALAHALLTLCATLLYRGGALVNLEAPFHNR